MAFLKAAASAKFIVICFRWSQVSSHIEAAGIIEPLDPRLPDHLKSPIVLGYNKLLDLQRRATEFVRESIQATLFSLKYAGIWYTRFIFSTNHCRMLVSVVKNSKGFNFRVYVNSFSFSNKSAAFNSYYAFNALMCQILWHIY